MARSAELQRFYARKAWQDLRTVKIMQTYGRCERCGADYSDNTPLLIAHHKEHLTDETLSDPAVALNPDNVELLCPRCHALQHPEKGFIKKKQQVFIVYGPPLSGKSTYVRQNMEAGDLVVDLDVIYTSISLLPMYERTKGLSRVVFAVRDCLYDQIRTRNGDWPAAWIIAGLPRKDERERLASRMGAECILIEATKEECHKRLEENPGGRSAEWAGHIDRWFADYIP